MGLGDTLRTWIDERATEWKGRLAGWAIDSTVNATESVAAHVEPQVLELVKAQIDALRNMEGLPPDVKAMLDKLTVPASPAVLVGLLSFLMGLAINLSTGLSKQMLQPVMQNLAKLSPFNLPDLAVVLDMQLRGKLQPGEYEDLVAKTGWSTAWADRFLAMKTPVFPSDLALQGLRRDPTKYAHFVADLPKLGLSAEQIELLTELSWRVPGVQDIIRYVVKEAYDEATVAEFGQDAEYPGQAEADAAKTGIRPEQLKLEWRAHWDLPGVSAGYEMLHRGEITEEKLDRLLKARDIMPGWRNELKAISWQLPGRIETRMMALYGLINKAGVVELLAKDGLAAEYRDVVADMNIVRGVKSDLQVRYTNGWINAAELQAEIAAQNLLPAIADQLYKSIVKNASAARTATQKSLTLAQIEKGVKKGKLTRPEAITLLVDLGYDLLEATYLLDVDVPEDDTDAATTNRELTKADILNGLKTNAISLPEARTRLIALRYLPADADYILRVYQLSIKPPDDPVERDISKADITAAVKLGLVTPTQGYALLRRIGFSDEAATFILALVPESSPFSPLNFEEFKALTGSWRRSHGMTDEVLPPAALELRVQQAQAVAEGRQPVLETLRIQIDTIRRNRRKGQITRDQEIGQLRELKVPDDYLVALVANDDARLTPAK